MEKGDWRAEWWTQEAAGDDQIRQMVEEAESLSGVWGGGQSQTWRCHQLGMRRSERGRAGQMSTVFEVDSCEGTSVPWGNSKGAQGGHGPPYLHPQR